MFIDTRLELSLFFKVLVGLWYQLKSLSYLYTKMPCPKKGFGSRSIWLPSKLKKNKETLTAFVTLIYFQPKTRKAVSTLWMTWPNRKRLHTVC